MFCDFKRKIGGVQCDLWGQDFLCCQLIRLSRVSIGSVSIERTVVAQNGDMACGFGVRRREIAEEKFQNVLYR